MARAKRTVRAEARRRYRAEHLPPENGNDGDADEAALDENPAPSRGGGARRPSGGPNRPGGPSAARPSTLRAFRDAYQPADIRGDLRALPQLIRSRAVVLPALLVAISAIIYAIAAGSAAASGSGLTGPSASPSASVAVSASPTPTLTVSQAASSSPDSGTSASPSPAASGAGSGTGSGSTTSGTPLGVIASILALLFLEIPPIGGIYVAAILAKRSSYLAGAIAGFLGPVGLLVAILVVSSDTSILAPALIAQVLIESTIFGLLIGAGLGYYRRLLRLMNPTPNRPTNRAKPAARRR